MDVLNFKRNINLCFRFQGKSTEKRHESVLLQPSAPGVGGPSPPLNTFKRSNKGNHNEDLDVGARFQPQLGDGDWGTVAEIPKSS